MDTREPMIEVEVVYALPNRQTMLQLSLPVGTTVQQAVELSGILCMFPEISCLHNKFGIFGKLVNLDTILRARDRVEIYRSLAVDPKEARRQRAKGSGTKPKNDNHAACQA